MNNPSESVYFSDQNQLSNQPGISLYKRSYNSRDNRSGMQSMSPKKNQSSLASSNFGRTIKTSPSLSGYHVIDANPVHLPSINDVDSKNDEPRTQGYSLINLSELKSSLSALENINEMRRSLDMRSSNDAQLHEHHIRSINPNYSSMVPPRGKSTQAKKPPLKFSVSKVDESQRVSQEEGQGSTRQVGIRLVNNLK